jgi:Ca-activated chloride channel family protein
MQCDVYMTFSPEGVFSSAADSVEVQFNFNIHSTASMTDMWLWVEEDIMKALILDRWTASSIYEGIVKRRRDPCLVLKDGPDYYNVKVYPLLGNGRRRIMLRYLLPMQWGLKGITIPLPSHLLRASLGGPPTFRVRYQPDPTLINPRLTEFPEKPFEAVYDSVAGPLLQTEIPGSLQENQTSMTLALDFASSELLTVSRFERNGEGFYQMAFLPSRVLGQEVARRVAILLDYDELGASIPCSVMVGEVRKMLTEHFTESDSFQLLYSSGPIVRQVSDTWIAATTPGIDAAFQVCKPESIGTTSRLRDLLIGGANFIHARENGTILLVSSSTDYCDYRVANPFMIELKNLLQPMIPVNIIDFCTRYYKVLFIDGTYFYNNVYLYDNLTRLTGGAFSTTNDWETQDFAWQLDQIVPYLRGAPGAMDVQTTLENGFCTARYTLGSTSSGLVSWDTPFHQVGKYYGSFPFIVEFSCLVNGKPTQKVFRVEAAGTVQSDSSVAQSWAAQWIAQLEKEPQTNQILKSIVDASISYRVLSTRTAFLALEPNDTIKACLTCEDQSGGPTDVVQNPEEDTLQTTEVTSYPNPFNALTTINVRLAHGATGSEVSVRIFNTLGQVVRTFDPTPLAKTGKATYTWDGRNDDGRVLASGMYLLVVSSSAGNSTAKLMLVK